MQDERCGIFGKWIVDDRGLPAIDYDCNEFTDNRAWHFTTYGNSNTQYHLLGNGCWLGIATNHGQVVVLDPRRGFTLIGSTPGKSALDMGGLVTFTLKDQAGNSCMDINTDEVQPLARRVFGAGYIEKKIAWPTITATTRIVFPAGSDPAIIAECTIDNAADDEQVIDIDATWNLYHLPLSKSLIVSWHKRKHYQEGSALDGLLKFAVGLQKIVKADTDGARCKHASNISFKVTKTTPSLVILTPSHTSMKKRDPAAASEINYHYKPVMIACLQAEPSITRNETRGTFEIKAGKYRVTITSKMTVPGHSTRNLRFFFCSAELDSMDAITTKFTSLATSNELLDQAASWFRDHYITFDVPGLPWLAREVSWDCIYLLSSSFKDEFYRLHRFPQASVYLLGHAFDGSIRDFCLFTYPLVFIDPALAREFLKFIYACGMDEHGKITYALQGFGKKLNVPGVHANPSDQYFFVTWITAEYIFLTRDLGFLDETITLKDERGKGTDFLVKDLLGRLIKFVLSPAIGLGEHDLVHVRDGDWNDGITLLAKNRNTFIKHGESTFNSAMLILSFAKAIPLVERFDRELAGSMDRIKNLVHEAMDKTWNGKWYCRGYDGAGHALGNDTIFLDHHAWMLQNPALPGDKMDKLLASIERELVDRSRCGAAIMYPPNSKSSILPPGWDINGGTWHALNALLAWGIRARAPRKAFDFLQKMSMHNRANQYPDIWYGQWSGSDAYIADYAKRPGEAFFHASTPMCDFPFMNNNLHAGFLGAVARFTGIEACHDRIKIDLAIDQSFTFRSKIMNIEKTDDEITIEPVRAFQEDFLIEILVPERFAQKCDIEIEPRQASEPEINGNQVIVHCSRDAPITTIVIKIS